MARAPPKPTDRRSVADCLWFTAQRLPAIVCDKAPRQPNNYDCGVYMLHFIERLSSMPLPSFESVQGIVGELDKKLFGQDEIDKKRDDMYTLLAKTYEDQHQHPLVDS